MYKFTKEEKSFFKYASMLVNIPVQRKLKQAKKVYKETQKAVKNALTGFVKLMGTKVTRTYKKTKESSSTVTKEPKKYYGLNLSKFKKGDDNKSQMSTSVSDEVSDKVSNKVADEVADEVSDKVVNEVTVEAANKVADEAADEVSDKVADKVTVEAANEVSDVKASLQTPVKASLQTPVKESIKTDVNNWERGISNYISEKQRIQQLKLAVMAENCTIGEGKRYVDEVYEKFIEDNRRNHTYMPSNCQFESGINDSKQLVIYNKFMTILHQYCKPVYMASLTPSRIQAYNRFIEERTNNTLPLDKILVGQWEVRKLLINVFQRQTPCFEVEDIDKYEIEYKKSLGQQSQIKQQ